MMGRREAAGDKEEGKETSEEKRRKSKKNSRFLEKGVSKMLSLNHVTGCSIAPPVLSDAKCKHGLLPTRFIKAISCD